MTNLNQIPTEELKKELQNREKRMEDILTSIIAISNNIESVTVDCLDEVCTINQFKNEISEYLTEIKAKMEEL